MKKILYGTSALLAAGLLSSSANAADPIKLQLGGFMNYYGAYVDQDAEDFRSTVSGDNVYAGGNKLNKFDILGDGEIYFKGETVLDNGVKVGTVMQLEAGTGDEGAVNNDTIFDDVYVYGDTAYGRVIAGSTGNVDKMLHVAAIDVGPLDIQASDINKLILPISAGSTGLTTNVGSLEATYIDTDTDANKVSYITPTYYGFTAGATYIPGTNNLQGSDNNIAGRGALDHGYVGTLAYSTVYENVGINATFGYGYFKKYDAAVITNINDYSTDQYSAGLQLTYQGFIIGGGYKYINQDTPSDSTAAKADLDEGGSVWNLGLAYEEGPYGVSVAYMKSVYNNVRSDIDKDEVKTWLVSGKYNLGAGVDTFATIGYRDYKSEARNAALTAAREGNDGWVALAGIGLTF